MLGFGLTRSESSSKAFIWATTGLFCVVYIISLSIVFQVAQRETHAVQERIIEDTCLCLAIELVLWDLFAMPLLLAALGVCSKRVVKRF